MPSVHGVHEGKKLTLEQAMVEGAELLRNSKDNLLGVLHSVGYHSYAFTANALISPQSGFDFQWYREFNEYMENTDILDVMRIWGSRGKIAAAWSLVRSGRLTTLLRILYHVKFVRKALRLPALEKGSKIILEEIDDAAFREPFFLYVNLMECHEPYTIGENLEAIRLDTLLNRSDGQLNWKDAYKKHSSLAIERAMATVGLLEKYDPLMIVTSDHGQLLGEGGRFGHGYFLDECLLRVPLYVRYPSYMSPLDQTKPFISLADIYRIAKTAVGTPLTSLGSEYAFAENYGVSEDLSRHANNRTEYERASALGTHRVAIFGVQGQIVYDISEDRIVSQTGTIDSQTTSRLISMLDTFRGESRQASSGFSAADEAVLKQRLKNLGYI
jgi:hypothetical protein